MSPMTIFMALTMLLLVATDVRSETKTPVKKGVDASESTQRVDIKTLNGLTYTKCKITKTEPDGITVYHSKGVAKIPFAILSQEYRKRYNYDPTNAIVGVDASESTQRVEVKTLNGLTYTKCKITKTEPDGITVYHSKGVAKIPFAILSEEYRKRYNYDPTNAMVYAQAAAKQNEEMRKRMERGRAEMEPQGDSMAKKRNVKSFGQGDAARKLAERQAKAENDHSGKDYRYYASTDINGNWCMYAEPKKGVTYRHVVGNTIIESNTEYISQDIIALAQEPIGDEDVIVGGGDRFDDLLPNRIGRVYSPVSDREESGIFGLEDTSHISDLLPSRFESRGPAGRPRDAPLPVRRSRRDFFPAK